MPALIETYSARKEATSARIGRKGSWFADLLFMIKRHHNNSRNLAPQECPAPSSAPCSSGAGAQRGAPEQRAPVFAHPTSRWRFHGAFQCVRPGSPSTRPGRRRKRHRTGPPIHPPVRLIESPPGRPAIDMLPQARASGHAPPLVPHRGDARSPHPPGVRSTGGPEGPRREAVGGRPEVASQSRILPRQDPLTRVRAARFLTLIRGSEGLRDHRGEWR